jgi:hypothetical protein
MIPLPNTAMENLNDVDLLREKSRDFLGRVKIVVVEALIYPLSS